MWKNSSQENLIHILTRTAKPGSQKEIQLRVCGNKQFYLLLGNDKLFFALYLPVRIIVCVCKIIVDLTTVLSIR